MLTCGNQSTTRKATRSTELMTDRFGRRHSLSLPPGTARADHVRWTKEFAGAHMPPAIAEILHKSPEPFVQVIYDIDVPRMALGRIALIGDAAFAVRPHAAAGTAKACADGLGIARCATRRERRSGDRARAMGAGSARAWPAAPPAYPRNGGSFAVSRELGPRRPIAPARPVRAGKVGATHASPPAGASARILRPKRW